jgi:hypothetical protein
MPTAGHSATMPAQLRRCLWLAIAAQSALLLAGLRHHLVWGGDLAWALNVAEAGALVVAAAVGSVAWWRAMAVVDPATDARTLLRWTLPLVAVALLAPPFLTTDPIDYVVRGRVLAVHGANPYVQVANDFPQDPFVQFGDRGWKDFPLPYGPVLANVQGAIAWLADLAPLPPRGQLFVAIALCKLLFAAALLVTARALAGIAAAGAQARTFLAIAWNPLLLAEGVANAHNDPLLTACLALAVAAAARARFGAATLAIGLGTLTKIVPIVAAPLVAVRALRERRLLPMLGGAMAVVAAAALFWWQFFRDPAAFGVASRQAELSSASIAWAVRELTGAPLGWLVGAGRAVVVALVAVGCLRLWRLAPAFDRRGERLATEIAIVMLALGCVGSALFTVWYHVWWLPLAFAGHSPFLRRLGIATTCVALLAYLPWTLARRLDVVAQVCTLVCAVLLPFALALGWPRRGPTAGAPVR